MRVSCKGEIPIILLRWLRAELLVLLLLRLEAAQSAKGFTRYPPSWF
jgi:hypothetical protein